MIKRAVFTGLCSLVCLLSAHAQELPFLGKWDITAQAPQGAFPYWLEVRVEGGELTGYFLNRGGSVFELPEIAVEEGELVFAVQGRPDAPPQVHRAHMEGDRLVGTRTVGDDVLHWEGVRPPEWGTHDANAEHRYGTPVRLFEGENLEHWTVQHADRPSGWEVVDGLMTNEAGANNLVSRQSFDDFKIQAEYKLEPQSNSGIYLRGRYELQVLDDHGEEPESHGHMGIYSRVAPAANVSRPAGEWQTMEATLVGNRVTVVLNGETVHDNVRLDGITGGALDSDEGAPGPIMIQGDHGKVWFRDVTVTPILE